MKPIAYKSRGFTLVEMIVAVSLLVIVILAVARIFSDASKAIGTSQASMEMFSNVRALADQMEEDVHSINRSGFLVIRSTVDLTDPTRRFDQISFLANGQFPNRTGTNSLTPFADPTVANSAFIHIGHGVVENAPNQMTLATAADLPSGTTDKDFVLLRNAILLITGPVAAAGPNFITVSPPAAVTPVVIAAYGVPAGATTPGPISLSTPGTPAIPVGAGETGSAVISSSRIDAADTSPTAIMQSIVSNITPLGGRTAAPRFEANEYCYRFRTLSDPYATEVLNGTATNIVNGYYRMHPILIQGCASFSVEWSDGNTYDSIPDARRIANDFRLMWFGAGLPRYVTADTSEPAVANGDTYTAIFSFDNRAKWPKALKFTYRVTDPNDRLKGGRIFTQVIRLPE